MRISDAATSANGLTASWVRSRAFWSVGWSGAFLLVSRLSSVLAVPLVLHSLGPALYGVWVVGGALIMIQGLFDLGIGAALVRFVAVVAARGSRHSVLVVFRRALLFYIGLSIAIGVPLWVWASEIAALMPSVHASTEDQAALLVRYVAVSFALTNVTLVLASLLQGVDRVDAAYRGQTLGWLAYVPLLAIGIHLDGAAQAVGLAWVFSYALQLALLSASTWAAVAELPTRHAPVPSWGQMFSLGGWWQLSSWADFATFQLPRLAGGFVLSANSLVALDVALRAAQLVVAPLFAVYPIVLPAAAKAWTLQGVEGLRAFVDRWFLPVAITLWLFATTFIPLEIPSLVAWTGRPEDSFNLWLNASVLLGVVAHASTGLFSSARLAAGNISPVLRYKKQQLALALVLIPPALFGGSAAVGLALGVALALPALAFDRREVEAFRVRFPARGARVLYRLLVATVGICAGLACGVWLLNAVVPPWAVIAILLPAWLATSAITSVWCWLSCIPRDTAPGPRASADAGRVA
jgi:O-antigen/teichoic acid export membrane protein